MTYRTTRRDVLRSAALAPLVLPFVVTSAKLPKSPDDLSADLRSGIDPDADLEYHEQLGTAESFAQWNLAACVHNARNLGQPWPHPVETIDWNEGDGPQFIIVCQHPDPDALDDILCEVLAEIASTRLGICDVARTSCGRAACFILAGTRALFVQRRRLAERGRA